MKEEESGLDIPEEEELLEKFFYIIYLKYFKIHITMTRAIFYTLKSRKGEAKIW